MIVKQSHNIALKRKAASFENVPLERIIAYTADDKPNVYSVVHETSYSYNQPVRNSKHLYRLQPVNDEEQVLLSYELAISIPVKGEIAHFTGSFGNNATFLSIPDTYSELKIISKSVVAVCASCNKIGALQHQPRTFPLIWMPWDRVMMNVYLQPPELHESQLFELGEYAMSFAHKNNNDVIEVMEDINRTIFKEYLYIPHVTTFCTTPYDIYLNRRGVCQDFAQLFICLARLLNIPARYRVGYVYTGGDYENKIRSDASHAWVEVYLPYIGWLGYDPTNGCRVEKKHVKVAAGRIFKDAAPTSGTIFGAMVGTKEELSTSVQVIQLNQ
jgi:transglutaminase-like putative cysteine protease